MLAAGNSHIAACPKQWKLSVPIKGAGGGSGQLYQRDRSGVRYISLAADQRQLFAGSPSLSNQVAEGSSETAIKRAPEDASCSAHRAPKALHPASTPMRCEWIAGAEIECPCTTQKECGQLSAPLRTVPESAADRQNPDLSVPCMDRFRHEQTDNHPPAALS